MLMGLSGAKLARAARRLNGILVLMTDDDRLPDPLPAARALPRGSVVILRSRNDSRRAHLAAALKKLPVILLIAGDAALAARIGAHGLHLPEARAREALHWRARFPHWFITAAAHSLRGAHAQVDAVLLSPVFPTQSHKSGVALTAPRARLMARQIQAPVIALGGIDARNAGLLKGLSGFAAIGALA
jgi:thiamine-phosphate pyrophosphorylase